MKSVSGKSLCKIVEQRRWILKRVNGSHHIYQSADNVDIKIGGSPKQVRMSCSDE